MALFKKKTSSASTPRPELGTKVEQVKKEETKSMKELYTAAETGKVKAVKTGEVKKIYGNAHKILAKPLVTEKVSTLGAINKYVFAVATGANKVEVAKAVKEIYGVKPIKVNIIRLIGKQARYGRITGKRKNWKKAIVTLPEGQSIKVYEGV